MEDLSEKAIRENCPHCDTTSQAFGQRLDETKNFHIVADIHPLIKGHILIIPKQHIACIGEYTQEMLSEFLEIYKKVRIFVEKEYGSASSFEHGKAGQTVFHSHVHVLPFSGSASDIIPEGKTNYFEMSGIPELLTIYKKSNQYLFFSLGETAWSVDPALAQAGFFRHRFAKALNNPDRGDWKAMHTNQALMKIADQENREVKARWTAAQPLL